MLRLVEMALCARRKRGIQGDDRYVSESDELCFSFKNEVLEETLSSSIFGANRLISVWSHMVGGGDRFL